MHQPKVYRQLALPVPVFDRIKEVQRQQEARTGQRLTIAQVVGYIVHAHAASEAEETAARAALLR